MIVRTPVSFVNRIGSTARKVSTAISLYFFKNLFIFSFYVAIKHSRFRKLYKSQSWKNRTTHLWLVFHYSPQAPPCLTTLIIIHLVYLTNPHCLDTGRSKLFLPLRKSSCRLGLVKYNMPCRGLAFLEDTHHEQIS